MNSLNNLFVYGKDISKLILIILDVQKLRTSTTSRLILIQLYVAGAEDYRSLFAASLLPDNMHNKQEEKNPSNEWLVSCIINIFIIV